MILQRLGERFLFLVEWEILEEAQQLGVMEERRDSGNWTWCCKNTAGSPIAGKDKYEGQ